MSTEIGKVQGINPQSITVTGFGGPAVETRGYSGNGRVLVQVTIGGEWIVLDKKRVELLIATLQEVDNHYGHPEKKEGESMLSFMGYQGFARYRRRLVIPNERARTYLVSVEIPGTETVDIWVVQKTDEVNGFASLLAYYRQIQEVDDPHIHWFFMDPETTMQGVGRLSHMERGK